MRFRSLGSVESAPARPATALTEHPSQNGGELAAPEGAGRESACSLPTKKMKNEQIG